MNSQEQFPVIEDNKSNSKIILTFENKDYNECLKLIEKALKHDSPNVYHKVLQAQCWSMLRINRTESYESLRKIISEDQKNAEAYFGLGIVFYYDGKLTKCVENLQLALKFNPSSTMQKAADLKQKAKSVIGAMREGKFKHKLK